MSCTSSQLQDPQPSSALCVRLGLHHLTDGAGSVRSGSALVSSLSSGMICGNSRGAETEEDPPQPPAPPSRPCPFALPMLTLVSPVKE